MSAPVVVFLGPSLDRDAATRILPDAVYLPPARMGDVYGALRRAPSAIAIIDGYFRRVASVWHKEVLFALSRGVRVFGAASMGALRAAELHAFGMEGVGRIFESYRSGELEDDDEVAVLHAAAAEGFRPLSDAMVNLRHGLARAKAAGLVSAATHDALVRWAKERFYPHRSWEALFQAQGGGPAVPAAELAALRDFVERERPDQKRDDAGECLRRIASERAAGRLAPHEPRFTFEPSVFFVKAMETTSRTPAAPGGEGGGTTLDALRRHVRALAPHRRGILLTALFHSLVVAEAGRLGIQARPEQVMAAAQRFALERKMKTEAELERWIRANRLTDDEFRSLLGLEVLEDELLSIYAQQADELLPLELRRRGLFPAIERHVSRKWRALEERGLANPTLADAGLDHAELIRWYRENVGPIAEPSLEAHAKKLGFHTLRELLNELLAEVVYRKIAPPTAGGGAAV